MPKIEYTPKQIEVLFKGIYSGAINLFTLPKNLYKSTAKLLNSGLKIGFSEVDNELRKSLQNNIYLFSGAKTATQVNEMKSILLENKGLDYPAFKKQAKDTYEKYNENYIQAEYNTTISAGNSAATWQDAIENKELFPRMKSICEMRPTSAIECIRMNGVIAPIDSPIWHNNVHPRHWNCNCREEPVDKYTDTPNTHASKLNELIKINSEEINSLFKNNPNSTGRVFNKNHPYFEIGKSHPDLAKKNFGLDIPK